MPSVRAESGLTATLSGRSLEAREDFSIREVRCSACRGSWSGVEETTQYVLVLARSGVFRRRVDGREVLVDPTVAYFCRPGEEQQIAHPVDGGDLCTSIALHERMLVSVWGQDPTDLPELVFTRAELDLSHRLLLAGCSAPDRFAVEERLHRLLALILAQHDPDRVESGRPSTAALRRRLVAGARERLACKPTLTLVELARELVVSPHHLSRVFSAATGVTLTRYRNRLRVRMAVERIDAGEESLTRLAAELGFADQAHLTRTVKAETGRTPSGLRALLADGRSERQPTSR